MGSNSDMIIENVEAPTFAPSLPVLNVQEMVRKEPLQVPERYIRNQEDRPQINDMSHLSSQIPLIDLSLLSAGDMEELNKLDLASKEWGFFQVVNHGVENKVLQDMKEAAAEFFELSLEEKNKYKPVSNDIQGYGQAYMISEDQILDWSDALMLFISPSQYRKLDFRPDTPKRFKEIIDAYSNGVKNVGEELLRSFSTIMGMNKDALLGPHKQVLQGPRVNYYPPCCRPDLVLGIGSHSDTSTITILMQGDDTDGLQIKHNGEWVPVKPVPYALVVNVGDAIEIWSNGKYKSIEHRAVTKPEKARISYASFLIPQDDVEIKPLDHPVNSQMSPKIYKKVRYGDYVRNSMKKKMERKAHVDYGKY